MCGTKLRAPTGCIQNYGPNPGPQNDFHKQANAFAHDSSTSQGADRECFAQNPVAEQGRHAMSPKLCKERTALHKHASRAGSARTKCLCTHRHTFLQSNCVLVKSMRDMRKTLNFFFRSKKQYHTRLDVRASWPREQH
jgi:hypothetical protein